jgi:hypothetical protein
MLNEKDNQNPNQNRKENMPKDEVDLFVNSTGDFLRLPQRDGDSVTYQFFNDKSKRALVRRTFIDPVTREEKQVIRVKYSVLHPDYPEQGEKPLEVPKTLAQQIEANINKNHCLQEITRHGIGPITRYTAIAA